MTTPAVDTLRNIPLIIEKDTPMAVDQDSGFPFDREERDDSFRSQLDDLAKRHPELAEHLDGFPFRSSARARPPRPSDESEFRRFANRPFGASSRFERFGFPFSRDPFDEDFQQHNPQQSQQHQPPPEDEQKAPPPPAEESQEEKQSQGRSRRPNNIQQSNTVDLGQKQEPVNDRNQRSMSAPPPDKRGQQRFVSSVNIPINRDGGMGDMGNQQTQQQAQQEGKANKPMERVIPIHVEGRDEPVMPKHTGPSFSQPQPQPERIFGQRPNEFTKFVPGRESPRQFGGAGEWFPRHEPTQQFPQQQQQKFQQSQAPPPQQQKFQQSQAPPPQQQKFQQAQAPPPQKPQEQQAPPPQPQQKTTTPNPIDIIQSIQKDVSELMGQVEKFDGVGKDKQYLYLDEMLTRNLIKLDNVDTQGQENIRQARKEAIKCIESCISILEAKAAASAPQTEAPVTKTDDVNMEAEAQVESQQPISGGDKMEVEVKGSSEEVAPEVAKPPENSQSETKPVDEEMKVVEEKAQESEAVKEASQEETSDDKDKKNKGKNKAVKK